MNNTLSVKECLTKGWTLFKQRPWFFVGTFVVYAIVQIILSWTQEVLPGIVSFALSLVVSTLLYMGLITMYLKAYADTKSPEYTDFWAPKYFWSYLGASILLAIIIIVGLFLLIIPGIFAALALSMTGYLIIDRGMKPIEAMKESMRITKGNRLKLFLFGLVVFGLSILGMIPLFLGLLVVAPVSMLAAVHAYRTLSGGEVVVVPAAAPAPSEAGS